MYSSVQELVGSMELCFHKTATVTIATTKLSINITYKASFDKGDEQKTQSS
jgi:hypothetical protein